MILLTEHGAHLPINLGMDAMYGDESNRTEALENSARWVKLLLRGVNCFLQEQRMFISSCG